MTRYQPIPENEADVLDPKRPIIAYSDDIDEKDVLAPLTTQHMPRRKWRRTSKICLAVGVVLFAFLLVVASGGLWVYRQKPVDGQSPPWYPSPQGGTVSTWQESYKKAQALVDRMTLVEKVNITTGVGWEMGLCVGNTGTAMRLGFPSLCLQDGPLGLRFTDHSTSFPAGITTGSTWNRELIRRRGAAHAREAKIKGVHVLLGPSMGAIGRNPAGGRAWESFGTDPVLQAVAASEDILGIQSQGIMATAKHFVGNEQEHFRQAFEWGNPQALSTNIDDRTLHELYSWPFAEAVRAGVASIMCSYNMVNNSYACGNSKLMNGILKDELGFQGFVVSDWNAQNSGVATALAGLDMTMPGDGLYQTDGKSFWGTQLTLAALNGSLPMSRLNDMTARIVAAWYQLGQDTWDYDGPNFSSWTNEKMGKWHPGASNSYDVGEVNKFVYAPNEESVKVAREVAAEGTVLLKNEGVLPLNPKSSAKIMVIGEDAGPGKGPNACANRACNQGTLGVGWGSGASDFMYLVDPLSAINQSMPAAQLSAHLSNEINVETREKLRQQDMCIVFANAVAGEGFVSWNGVRGDRNDLELQKGGATLIQKVADSCGGTTIVIIHAVGPVIMEGFADHPNVKAILHANLPGQESGHALCDVLFGRVDASGRLAYTIGRSLDDYGEFAKVMYYPNHIIPQVDFKEGIFIDYRHFDRYNIEPRYPFGHGLSYTTFTFSDLEIVNLKPKSALPAPRPNNLDPPTLNNTIPEVESALFPSSIRRLNKYIYPYLSNTKQVKHGAYRYPDGYEIHQTSSQAGGAEGGNPSLFHNHVAVRVKVTNSGNRAGKEVVQLYLTYPQNILDGGSVIEMPSRLLRNFQKIELEPGASIVVEMNLTRKDLSYWSVVQQNWVMPEHDRFSISIGKSSRNLILKDYY